MIPWELLPGGFVLGVLVTCLVLNEVAVRRRLRGYDVDLTGARSRSDEWSWPAPPQVPTVDDDPRDAA